MSLFVMDHFNDTAAEHRAGIRINWLSVHPRSAAIIIMFDDDDVGGNFKKEVQDGLRPFMISPNTCERCAYPSVERTQQATKYRDRIVETKISAEYGTASSCLLDLLKPTMTARTK